MFSRSFFIYRIYNVYICITTGYGLTISTPFPLNISYGQNSNLNNQLTSRNLWLFDLSQ